jgi:hypothetical protein
VTRGVSTTKKIEEKKFIYFSYLIVVDMKLNIIFENKKSISDDINIFSSIK